MHVNTEGASYLIVTVDQVDGATEQREASYAGLGDTLRALQVSGHVPVAVSLIERVEPVEEPPAALIPSIDEAVAAGMLPDRSGDPLDFEGWEDR